MNNNNNSNNNYNNKLKGAHTIVSVSCNKALDGNVEVARDIKHPRVFLWEPVPSALNHQWVLVAVEDGEYYMIINNETMRALDGNINPRDVNNLQSSYPFPFTWEPVRTAPNHHWKLEKVAENTYVIINRANGLALDANVSAAIQVDPNHPSPFLWQPVPSASNHRWIITKQD